MKETVMGMKRQTKEWEKKNTEHKSHKNLVSRIYKELKTEWSAKDLNKHFTKDIQMENKYKKRFSTLLIFLSNFINLINHY